MLHGAAIAAGLAAAAGAYQQAEQQALARMSPAERAAWRIRVRERREREFAAVARRRERETLDASPEVVLARSIVLAQGLSPDATERLLDFARQLARERVQ